MNFLDIAVQYRLPKTFWSLTLSLWFVASSFTFRFNSHIETTVNVMWPKSQRAREGRRLQWQWVLILIRSWCGYKGECACLQTIYTARPGRSGLKRVQWEEGGTEKSAFGVGKQLCGSVWCTPPLSITQRACSRFTEPACNSCSSCQSLQLSLCCVPAPLLWETVVRSGRGAARLFFSSLSTNRGTLQLWVVFQQETESRHLTARNAPSACWLQSLKLWRL